MSGGAEKEVFLALGSNLGDRAWYLEQARAALASLPQTHLTGLSAVRPTSPLGETDQPEFLNQVVRIATRLAPEELLARCQEIEGRFGRVRLRRWGPRTCDIDILLVGSQVIDSPHLRIPHAELLHRPYLLELCQEIDPEIRHPVTGEPLARYCGAGGGGPFGPAGGGEGR